MAKPDMGPRGVMANCFNCYYGSHGRQSHACLGGDPPCQCPEHPPYSRADDGASTKYIAPV